MTPRDTILVFGYAGSINVRKVLWACDEVGIEYVREDWGGGHRSTSEESFRKLSPMGMVPVINDRGAVISESNTIVRYLAASRGRSDLLPIEPLRRAQIERWMDWQASDFNNSWRYAFQALVRRHPDYREQAAITRSLEQFASMIAIVDGQLRETGSYITGPEFTVADIAIGLAVHRWFALQEAPPPLDDVRKYYERLCNRPGFRRYGSGGGP